MKRMHRRFEPRLRVWKLKTDKTREETADLVYTAVEEKRQECSDINDCWEL